MGHAPRHFDVPSLGPPRVAGHAIAVPFERMSGPIGVGDHDDDRHANQQRQGPQEIEEEATHSNYYRLGWGSGRAAR